MLKGFKGLDKYTIRFSKESGLREGIRLVYMFALRGRYRGHCKEAEWFLGNARRVQGDIPGR